jgi:hypothetical protein
LRIVVAFELSHNFKQDCALRDELFKSYFVTECGFMSLNEGTKPLVYFALANEQFTTPELLKFGVAAEEAGFDGVWTSDHFQPWQH